MRRTRGRALPDGSGKGIAGADAGRAGSSHGETFHVQDPVPVPPRFGSAR